MIDSDILNNLLNKYGIHFLEKESIEEKGKVIL